MKRAFVLLILLLPSVAAFGQQKALTLEEAVNEWVLGMNEALTEAKVAVISIDSPDPVIAEDIIKVINVAITQTNAKTKKITRIERAALDKVYDELDFQTSRSVDQNTAKRIGKILEVDFVIYGSYSPQDEDVFALYLCAANVETGAVSWEDIKRVRRKINLFRSDAWENSRLYLGLRFGISPRFYGISADIPSGSADTGFSLEGAFQASVCILSISAFEVHAGMEVFFGTDTVSYSGKDGQGDFTASFTSAVLEIPLLAKASYRIGGRFIFSLFTGPYFPISLGNMEYASGGDRDAYRFHTPPGWLVGIAPGIRLGPGTLSADVRYCGDIGNTSISDGSGTLQVYSRGRVSFALGYELGFIIRK